MALDLNIFSNAVEPKEIKDMHKLCLVDSIIDECQHVCSFDINMHNVSFDNHSELLL